MRIVVDANVFVSAFISGGYPRAIIERIADGLDTLLTTGEIISEIGAVLGRPKFKKSVGFVDAIISDIRQFGELVAVSPKYQLSASACRDPKDVKYLECAVAGRADCIVSGDRDLQDMREYAGVRIFGARPYLEVAL